MGKKASDYIPFCQDEGMQYLAGGMPGMTVQIVQFTMVSGGAVIFADEGLQTMADANYMVWVQNQTDAADEATIGTKTGAGFVITGPDNSDELDVLIIGRAANQVA